LLAVPAKAAGVALRIRFVVEINRHQAPNGFERSYRSSVLGRKIRNETAIGALATRGTAWQLGISGRRALRRCAAMRSASGASSALQKLALHALVEPSLLGCSHLHRQIAVQCPSFYCASRHWCTHRGFRRSHKRLLAAARRLKTPSAATAMPPTGSSARCKARPARHPAWRRSRREVCDPPTTPATAC